MQKVRRIMIVSFEIIYLFQFLTLAVRTMRSTELMTGYVHTARKRTMGRLIVLDKSHNECINEWDIKAKWCVNFELDFNINIFQTYIQPR